ncbi:hypothetical protein GCM10009111_11020 [Colwellia asteriadis]|uniref:Uncharacterized protein n=1 Tax=Colwellia asteriadis TaxID=517723 RepID=A0ABN1L4Y8_9GAMM
MRIWPSIKIDETDYDLAHLTGKEFSYKRAATQDYPEKTVRFYLEYSNHCFTEHFGDHEYGHGADHEIRYFCSKRYEHSKGIYDLIKKVISENVFMQLTFNEHREQFYYLEEHYNNTDYRLFIEVSKSNHTNSDIRLKVVSAYEPRPGSDSVGGSGWFRFFKIVDARIDGRKLERKRRR